MVLFDRTVDIGENTDVASLKSEKPVHSRPLSRSKTKQSKAARCPASRVAACY